MGKRMKPFSPISFILSMIFVFASGVSGSQSTNPSASPWQSLPPLQAGPGVTALAGQVLTLSGQPLPNVTLRIEDNSTQTDDSGRFLLSPIPSGHGELLIDGRTAGTPGLTYGIFEVGAEVQESRTNVLPYTIWMPSTDTPFTITIPSPTVDEVVVTTPHIPYLEVRIPAGTVIYDHEGQVVTQVSITPIPVDRPPFPLPPGVNVPTYFTIQPGGAYLKNELGTGARLIYPNSFDQPAGTQFDFWNYDPEEKGWFIYGQGVVLPDRKQVMPDPGVTIYEFTGAMVANPAFAPASGPAPGNPAKGGDPVDLGTGLFVLEKTDLVVPDVIPIVLARTYRPNDSRSRPFGIGASHSYEMFIVGDKNPYTYADIILADGSRIHYTRISPGTGFTDAVYEHTASPTPFYKSRIAWNGNGWNLTLKDGGVYVFPDAELATSPAGAAIILVQDRYGNALTLTRDATTKNLTKITTPNGRFIEFTYDTSNRIKQAKDHTGRVVAYTYDNKGRLSKVTDPTGKATSYSYDASHRLLTITDPKRIKFLTNLYDANGRVTKQTQADGTTYLFAYTIGGAGKITRTDATDPRGIVRRVTFNADGYTLTDTHALGKPEQQTLTYERQAGTNLVLSLTDALGRKTAYTYDAMGNVTSVTYLAQTPDAVTTTLTYEPTFNQVASVTDPLSHTTSFAYDSFGNLTTATDPLGHRTTLTYNTQGQPVSVTDPLSNTTRFTYDVGDLASVSDPLGNSVDRFTDSVGRLLSLTNALGQRTRYEYDPLNQLTKITDALSGITSFTYDANGNLLTVKDAKNQTTTYTYNSMDRLATRKDALLKSESYIYDGNGNLTKITDRKGQITTFSYDALNRRTQATFTGGSTTTYTYDAGNRLTQVVDSLSGTITLTFDNLDRLTREVTPQGTVDYTYDAAGRRTSMTVQGQLPVTYTYDNASRLTQVTQGSQTVAISYDAAGRRTSFTLPNGIVTAYTYDAASRLTGLTYTLGVPVMGNLTYSYDAVGNRTVIGGSWARTGLPQPVSSATYNAANQQLTFGNTNLTYDLNGNLTSATDPFGSATYTWDTRNRLSNLSATGLTASFAYDGLGRRTTKTINGTSTSFVYDGQNPVQEKAGAAVTGNVLTGLGIDEYFTRTDAAGTRALLTDALGSTVALADTAGAVQTEYTYEPFGTTTVAGAASASSYQYTGRENDGTGLYYYRARYYSPTLNKFISKDPIGFAGGDINLYAYVLNNPLGFIDPFGLYVAVTYYPSFATHVGVGVNTTSTVGFYPTNVDLLARIEAFFGFDVPGAVYPDTTVPGTKTITIPTSPEQDRAVQAAIDAFAKDPGNYNLWGRNCATFASDVLRAGGINAPNTIDPGMFINQLSDMVRQRR